MATKEKSDQKDRFRFPEVVLIFLQKESNRFIIYLIGTSNTVKFNRKSRPEKDFLVQGKKTLKNLTS
ncbi:hypothetical protein PACTADRAFT_50031 [Pachysolen tannophilus NRRL Y-2460]|uniref:Uncharacterized protein n=1 Tax=Pachysolen tannophilus NRRL Y-2460 TaxID=669874 RepID=A0A1E4TU78_PACTA|nr:hypothetical protein PACTADRAFT_50031 [Pachysolen tannophilus NRRL Y-2460]